MATVVPGGRDRRTVDVRETAAVDAANAAMQERIARKHETDEYWQAVRKEFGGNIGLAEDATHGGLRPVYPEMWAADASGAVALGKLAGKVVLPLARRTIVPVSRSVYKEIAGNIGHLRGNSPRVILPVGPRGHERIMLQAGSADSSLREAARTMDVYRSKRIPGETVPVYTVAPKLSAQGRATLDADATLLDRLYAGVRRQLRMSDEGVPVDQLLAKADPDARSLRLAYPKGLRDTKVSMYRDLGSDVSGRAIMDPRSPKIELNTAGPGSRVPTFAHEFKHTVEMREPFWKSARGFDAAIAHWDPAVASAVNRMAKKIPMGTPLDEFRSMTGRIIDDEMYATQIHENTARLIGLMNRSGARDYDELLQRLPVQTDEIGRRFIQHPDSPSFPVYLDEVDLQRRVLQESQVPDTNMDAKGGDTRAASKGGNGDQPDDIPPEPGEGASSFPPSAGGGPRIVINPTTFRNKKDALCVAFNEAFRVVMEDMQFDPVAEPTERQRKFFSDTAYADDETQLRRTILARICTFDTSVKDPTDEQLEEAVEFLDSVMEAGIPQNEWEQSAVQRIRDVVEQSVGRPQAPEEPAQEPAQEPAEEVQADYEGGETEESTDAGLAAEEPQATDAQAIQEAQDALQAQLTSYAEDLDKNKVRISVEERQDRQKALRNTYVQGVSTWAGGPGTDAFYGGSMPGADPMLPGRPPSATKRGEGEREALAFQRSAPTYNSTEGGIGGGDRRKKPHKIDRTGWNRL